MSTIFLNSIYKKNTIEHNYVYLDTLLLQLLCVLLLLDGRWFSRTRSIIYIVRAENLLDTCRTLYVCLVLCLYMHNYISNSYWRN